MCHKLFLDQRFAALNENDLRIISTDICNVTGAVGSHFQSEGMSGVMAYCYRAESASVTLEIRGCIDDNIRSDSKANSRSNENSDSRATDYRCCHHCLFAWFASAVKSQTFQRPSSLWGSFIPFSGQLFLPSGVSCLYPI